jgi:hypothetical protein
VAHLDEDRPLHPDHTAMQALVRSGAVLDAVEDAIGPLDGSAPTGEPAEPRSVAG